MLVYLRAWLPCKMLQRLQIRSNQINIASQLLKLTQHQASLHRYTKQPGHTSIDRT